MGGWLRQRVALTGGIATGKSTVAEMFSALGVTIIDADRVARACVEPGTDCWQELYRLLGPEYFDERGHLKRRETRLRVIHEPGFRSLLNTVLHPHIVAAMEAQWASWQLSSPECPILFDVPLLFEGGFETSFDVIILVYAAPEVQVRRLVDRDRISPREAEKTLAIQLPIDSKKSRADIVIDNGGSIENTRQQVQAVWDQLFSDKHHGGL